jgi:Diaphanous FH3 Domain
MLHVLGPNFLYRFSLGATMCTRPLPSQADTVVLVNTQQSVLTFSIYNAKSIVTLCGCSSESFCNCPPQFQVDTMVLVNTLLQTDDFELRLSLRAELCDAGILEAIDGIKEKYGQVRTSAAYSWCVMYHEELCDAGATKATEGIKEKYGQVRTPVPVL